MRRLLLVLVAVLLCSPLGQAIPAAKADVAAPRVASKPVVTKPFTPKTGPYTCWRSATPTCRVSPGITFSSANGSRAQKWAIINKIVSTIRRTPSSATIHIMSWNIMSDTGVSALIDAARRGVRVRVLMDSGNQSREVPNPGFTRMVRAFRASNVKWPAARRSYAKKCQGACRRGNAGSAHAKYYMFSQVGASRNVVMQGSANLTNAAASNQWNDLFTYVDNPGLYSFTNRVFNQMWGDQYVYPAWTGYPSSSAYSTSSYGLYFSPRIGGEKDPLTAQLEQVQCLGAVNAGNSNGRTIIRAAPDVFRGTWGDEVARHLKRLWDNGCDVRVGYTVLGISTRQILTRSSGRGAVPLRQLAQDVNGDRVFDKYFHLKAWTINGHSMFGGTSNKTYFWTMQGSSNVSDLSKISDENIGVFRSKAVTLAYQNYISRWFANPPRSRPVIPSLVPKNLDPYANMEMD